MIDQALPAAVPVRAGAATWRDYVDLLKPRVMSLVVLTAVTGLVCARTPMNPVLAFVAILCITLGDGDIDALMRRTRGRAVPAGRIQRSDAMGLGIALSLFSVVIMGLAINVLSAALLAFTIFFYSVVYTRWLKRRTVQNIVIGGLAGALPPLVGWAAASGTLPANAWLLVAIIFVWTPPHFWALSLYTSEDYAKAGVPMMPVVKGAASTRRQILLYSLVLIPLCIAPAFTGLGGVAYLIASAGGGVVFLVLAVRLAASQAGEKTGERTRDGALYDVKAASKSARNLFAFSILYLFLIFGVLLGEHVLGAAPLALLR